jgi:hypothetical protein
MGWFITETALPMSWHSEATTTSSLAPASSARVQRVDELINLEAVGDLLERGQHAEDSVGHAGLVLDRADDDGLPLLFGRLVHSGERHVLIIPQGSRGE